MDDSYVTHEEATAALGRLRSANHLSVQRYRDIVYCLQFLMANPGETNTPPTPKAADIPKAVFAELPSPPPDLSTQIKSEVASMIAAALESRPACTACDQPLPEPENDETVELSEEPPYVPYVAPEPVEAELPDIPEEEDALTPNDVDIYLAETVDE